MGVGGRGLLKPLRIGLWAFTILAGGALTWAGSRSLRLPYFEIAEVIVEGNLQLSAQEIVADLALPPHAGLLTVDLRALSVRLLRNPWIKEATLRRRLPRSLVIRIVERAPEMVLIGDKAYLLSADGVILSELEEAVSQKLQAISLPVLRVPTDQRYGKGEVVLKPEVVRGLTVWRDFQLHNALPGEWAQEIILAKDGSYTVNLGPEMPFIRLKAEDMVGQLERLKRVLAFTKEGLSRYESVDLRFGEKVIVRPKGGRGGQGV